jgi:hypothetical protein
MPIHMGMMCEACRKVHFIATSPGIRPSPVTPEMYFAYVQISLLRNSRIRKDALHPYRVTDEVFKRGYAEESECGLIPAQRNPADRQKAGESEVNVRQSTPRPHFAQKAGENRH